MPFSKIHHFKCHNWIRQTWQTMRLMSRLFMLLYSQQLLSSSRLVALTATRSIRRGGRHLFKGQQHRYDSERQSDVCFMLYIFLLVFLRCTHAPESTAIICRGATVFLSLTIASRHFLFQATHSSDFCTSGQAFGLSPRQVCSHRRFIPLVKEFFLSPLPVPLHRTSALVPSNCPLRRRPPNTYHPFSKQATTDVRSHIKSVILYVRLLGLTRTVPTQW